MQEMERSVMAEDLSVDCICRDRIPPRPFLLWEVALVGELIVALLKAFSGGCPEMEEAEEHCEERMNWGPAGHSEREDRLAILK
jgi:hypothetical protein